MQAPPVKRLLEVRNQKASQLKEAFHSTTAKFRRVFPDRATQKRLLQMNGNKSPGILQTPLDLSLEDTEKGFYIRSR